MEMLESSQWLNNRWYFLVAAGIIVNALGLFTPIIEPDGALYATLSKNMVLSGDYIDLVFQGKDWLDKPHFQFWITALSFNLFGINTIGYKLPALLFWALGIIYTYRFAKLFYTESVARLSALIYLSAFHLVLSNNDVRAEPYLTGLIIAAIYHCYSSTLKPGFVDILWGACFSAAAVMTKGIFVAIIIFSGIVLHWFFHRPSNGNATKRLILVMGFTLIFITPEIFSLYWQFDLHPEKIIFGRTSVSAVRFFFWDSQFGRFFNTGPIRGEGDPFFFLHTSLWAFFPWSVLFFISVFKRLRDFKLDSHERITLFGTIIGFLLFSLSKFQLPHYLNVLFPLMCVQTANFIFISEMKPTLTKGLLVLSTIVSCTALSFLTHFSLPQLLLPTAVLATIIIIFLYVKKHSLASQIVITFSASIILYAFINLFLVPTIIKYEAGLSAARFLSNSKISLPVVVLPEKDESYSFDFYYDGNVIRKPISELKKRDRLVYCRENYMDSLLSKGLRPEIIKAFPYYKVSQPSGDLLNASLRDKSPGHYLLVKVN